MSINRGLKKPPCPCFHCRYQAWLHRCQLRKEYGMKRMPPRPVKDPFQPFPCPCTGCKNKAAYIRKLAEEKKKNKRIKLMATINDERVVLMLMRNEGKYFDDPQVQAISTYTTIEGKTTWHLAMKGLEEIEQARNSPFVKNLKVLWRKEGGYTNEGMLFLDDHKHEPVT